LSRKIVDINIVSVCLFEIPDVTRMTQFG
jgi:hypothetical protein